MFKITYKFGGNEGDCKNNRIQGSYKSSKQSAKQSILTENPDENAQLMIDRLLSESNDSEDCAANNWDFDEFNDEK